MSQVTQAHTSKATQTRILTPVPYQVQQRWAFHPPKAHAHNPGGPALGLGQIPVQFECPRQPNESFLYRAVALVGAYGIGVGDWAPLLGHRTGATYAAVATVPAGGWYRLEVRGTESQARLAASVEPVGVGEVFVIAGQSYAEGCNDELLRVQDPHARVSAYDVVGHAWRVAHDPQPNLGEGGTIWPPMADALLPLARVPIGFFNVASGGTASRQWLPGEQLYQNLARAVKKVGRFRAVLWQQGESDVIEGVSTQTYVENLVEIRSSLAEEWGFDAPWLLAKSTLHPTVYHDPQGEERIRAATDRLWRMPGFRPGPDTDILDGAHRGGPDSRRHLTGLGQRRAGLMWFVAVWNELNRCSAESAEVQHERG